MITDSIDRYNQGHIKELRESPNAQKTLLPAWVKPRPLPTF